MKFSFKQISLCGTKRYARHIEKIYEKHEHKIGPLAMLVGVVFDFFAFRRIDLPEENMVLVGYLVVGAIGITVVNLCEGGLLKGGFYNRIRVWLPLIIQFSFGGLFSAFMVFYLRSASILASWPYFTVLLALIVGNEFFRKKYMKLTFHMSVYFLAMYSYAVFILPVVFRSMGPSVFVASGLISLVLMALFVYFLSKLIPEKIREAKQTLIWSIRTIFVFMNLFYFANIIPPIPLALKEAGVFYNVSRVENRYEAVTDNKNWYDSLGKDKIWIKEGEPVYVFTSVFSPTNLNVPITHKWQYRDSTTKNWIVADEISYPIVGGRDGGYRGYTVKRMVFPGEWRVDVVTDRDRIIGRVRFEIVDSSVYENDNERIVKYF